MVAIPEIRVEVAFQETPSHETVPANQGFGDTDPPMWTDVSDRVRLPEGMSWGRGRQYELDQIQPGTAAFVLLNDDGRFTPGKVGPHWPHVVPGRRTRGRAVWQGIAYPLWDTYVDSWGSGWPQRFAGRNLVQVASTDRLKVLSRHVFQSALVEETVSLGEPVIGYWPLTEQVDIRAEFGDNGLGFRPTGQQQGSLGFQTIGSAGEVASAELTIVGAEGQSGVQFGRVSSTDGRYLAGMMAQSLVDLTFAFSISLWIAGVSPLSGGAGRRGLVLLGESDLHGMSLQTTESSVDIPVNSIRFVADGLFLLDGPPNAITDGAPHHVVVTMDLTNSRLYIDGVEVDSSTGNHGTPTTPIYIGAVVAENIFTGELTVERIFDGTIGHVVVFNDVLNSQEVEAIFERGVRGLLTGEPANIADGENTSVRAQFLTNRYVDKLPAEIGLDDVIPPSDAGRIAVGHQNLSGRSATDLLAELSTAAGGVNFIGPDGTLRTYSADRRRRVAPAFYLDAANNEVTGLDFSADDQLLVNDLDFAGANGAKGNVQNPASISRFGRFRGQLDFPLNTPDEARARAQRHVRDFGAPRPRTQSIEIDLVANPHLFPALLSADLFDRFDTIGLPINAPASSMPWLVEKIEHRVTEKTWVCAIQASPYDQELQPEDLMQVFTSSGTYNKPAGLVAVKVRVVAGAGAGGGAVATAAGQASCGGGGQAGGYAEKVIMAADIGATETVTVGAGGAGVSGANGNAGGTSSFGTHCSAAGGAAGSASAASAATAVGVAGSGGGAASGGDINISGGDGFHGQVQSALLQDYGHGGASVLSGSRAAGANFSNGGVAGQLYGGGGTGAHNGASQAARAGGNGAAGIVLVENNLGSGFQ